MRMDEGVGRRVVTDLGVDQERVRAEIVRIVSSAQRPAESRRPLVRPASEQTVRRRDELRLRWVSLAAAFGIGILVGWAIWGH